MTGNTKEREIRRYIDLCIQQLIVQLPDYTGKNGEVLTNSVNFTIPGTDNTAIIQLASLCGEISFRVHVIRIGTSRAYSNYLNSFPFSKTEEFLKKEVDRDDIYDSIVNLSKSVDEYW